MHPGGEAIKSMDLDQLDLNPRITAAVKKGGLRSVREVLCCSGPDLERLTNLSSPDVQRLLTAASLHLRGSHVLTALRLFQESENFPEQHQRLSLGCPVLNQILGGGLPLEGITELAGCSSAGKTQLALQLCLTVQLPQQYGGLDTGAVYICTEDVFPSRRLQQLITQHQQLRMDVPGEVVQKIKFSNQIFVEHVADVDALLECVSKKVPILLSKGMARLVVVDSVAAPFRCEFDSQASALRAQHLQMLGAALRRLSSAFRSPVLCINQVTEAVKEQESAPGPLGAWDEHLSPALGITWANQLLMSVMVSRVREEDATLGLPSGPARTLRVLFAPHLPHPLVATQSMRKAFEGHQGLSCYCDDTCSNSLTRSQERRIRLSSPTPADIHLSMGLPHPAFGPTLALTAPGSGSGVSPVTPWKQHNHRPQ